VISSRRRFLVAYGLWAFVVFAYFVPGATWSPASRFALTRAIVEHGSLTIDGFEGSTGDRALRDGHWYSDKAPVPSLLAVPVYFLFHAVDRLRGSSVEFEQVRPGSVNHIRVNRSFQAGLYLCSLVTAGVSGALLAVLLFDVLRARTTPVGALVASACVVLATPVFPYATSFYGHTVAALFLSVTAAIAFKHAPSSRELRLAGACVALATGSEYLTAIPGAVLVAWYVSSRPDGSLRLRAVLDLLAGAAAPVAVIGAYNAACFGAPWRPGYAFIVQERFAAGQSLGLFGVRMPRLVALGGLLFGPRRGLFFVAPVAFAGVVGLVARAYKDDRTSQVALGVASVMLLASSGYYMWWGGAAAGPRHLVPVLPMLGYGYAAAWEGTGARGRTVLSALGILSFGILLAFTAVGLEAPEHGNVLTDYVWLSLVRHKIATIRGASNLGLAAGMSPLASLIPVTLWAALGMAWLTSRANRAAAP
jgi:hypothetical protein